MGVDVIPAQQIEAAIYLIRGMKVMLDSDLAALYGVKTKELNKAVVRNRDRFPSDFVFQLTAEEVASLRFQIGTSSLGHGGKRYPSHAFADRGVATKAIDLRCVGATYFGRRDGAATRRSVGRRAASRRRRQEHFEA